MAHKIRDQMRGSNLIKRILSFCGGLVVFFFCLMPAAPAEAYSDGEAVTTYAPFPFEMTVYTSGLDIFSVPMFNVFNDRLAQETYDLTMAVGDYNYTVQFTPFSVDHSNISYCVNIPDAEASALGFNWRGYYIYDFSYDDSFGFYFPEHDVHYDIRYSGYYQTFKANTVTGEDGYDYPGTIEYGWEALSGVVTADVDSEVPYDFDISSIDPVNKYEDATGIFVLTSISILIRVDIWQQTPFSFNFVTTAHDTYTDGMINFIEDTTMEVWPIQPEYAPIEPVDFTDWIVVATTGFLSFELVPGLSLQMLFWSILGILFVIMVLKHFAGG